MHTERTHTTQRTHTEHRTEHKQNNMQHIEQDTEHKNNTEQHTDTETNNHAENSAHNYRTYSLDYYFEYAYIRNSNTIELYTISK